MANDPSIIADRLELLAEKGWEEARWLTSPAEANRWRFGTWVDVKAYSKCSSYGTIGMPAWFLPWNRNMQACPSLSGVWANGSQRVSTKG